MPHLPILMQDIIDLAVKVKHMHLISSSEGFALYQKCMEIERAAKIAYEERQNARKKETKEEQHEKEGWKDKLLLEGKLAIGRKEGKGKEKEKDERDPVKATPTELLDDGLLLEERLHEKTTRELLHIETDQELDNTTKKKIMRYLSPLMRVTYG